MSIERGLFFSSSARGRLYVTSFATEHVVSSFGHTEVSSLASKLGRAWPGIDDLILGLSDVPRRPFAEACLQESLDFESLEGV